MERIVRQLAREQKTVPAKAADQLQKVLYDLRRQLRQGKPATLPGVGRFLPGTELKFQFEQLNEKKSTKKNEGREKQRRNTGRTSS